MSDTPTALEFQRKPVTDDQSGFFQAVVSAIQDAGRKFPDVPIDEVLAIVGQVAGAMAAQFPPGTREAARYTVVYNLDRSFDRNTGGEGSELDSRAHARIQAELNKLNTTHEGENAAPAEA